MSSTLKFGIQNLLKDDYKDSNHSIQELPPFNDQCPNNWKHRCKQMYNFYSIANYKRRMNACNIMALSKGPELIGRSLMDKNRFSHFTPNGLIERSDVTNKNPRFYNPQLSLASLEKLSKLWINKSCLIACYQEMHSKPRKTMLRRSVFSDSQRKGLEIAFKKHPYITKIDRKELAEELCLKDSQVKIWFQNRRMKWRNTRLAEKK